MQMVFSALEGGNTSYLRLALDEVSPCLADDPNWAPTIDQAKKALAIWEDLEMVYGTGALMDLARWGPMKLRAPRHAELVQNAENLLRQRGLVFRDAAVAFTLWD